MNIYITDKCILMILSTIVCVFSIGVTPISVFAFLMMISFFGIHYYFMKPMIFHIILAVSIGLCFAFAPFCFYIPTITYDMFLSYQKSFRNIMSVLVISILPYLFHASYFSPEILITILLVFSLSLLLANRNKNLTTLEHRYMEIRNESEDEKIFLELKNKDLMEKQDYEIHTATLRERNRIAREIHDNVGHMLSRSILQVGAQIALCNNEEEKNRLYELKETLTSAMTSIRESVHDLHDESLDLHREIDTLIKHFTFCPVTFEYNITAGLNRRNKYAILAIIKEAFSNIIKYSNATNVSLILREHPALYQLLIQDNGTSIGILKSDGMGLSNIKERVESLDGLLKITTDQGFRIFISIPRKKEVLQ